MQKRHCRDRSRHRQQSNCLEGRYTERLSFREIECLKWIARGKSSWEIARVLDISQNTVRFHTRNVLKKLNAANRVIAVVASIRAGLIAIEEL
jgi:DNA-binding CsgD family transcriptional regulator